MHEQYINELSWYANLKLGYKYRKLIAIIIISSEIIRINKENDFTSFTSVWCWITVQTNFKNWCTHKKFIIYWQLETYSILANFGRYEMHVGVWANYLTFVWSLLSPL